MTSTNNQIGRVFRGRRKGSDMVEGLTFRIEKEDFLEAERQDCRECIFAKALIRMCPEAPENTFTVFYDFLERVGSKVAKVNAREYGGYFSIEPKAAATQVMYKFDMGLLSEEDMEFLEKQEFHLEEWD